MKTILKNYVKLNFNKKTFTTINCYISLGSNIGNRVFYLNEATNKIRKFAKVLRTSKIYEGECIDYNGKIVLEEKKFLNTMLEIQIDDKEIPPQKLLVLLKEIEKELGRDKKKFYYQPRKIDLDIVLYGNEIINEKLNSISYNIDLDIETNQDNKNLFLKIPQDKISKRPYVLESLINLNKCMNIPILNEKNQKIDTPISDILEEYKKYINIEAFNKKMIPLEYEKRIYPIIPCENNFNSEILDDSHYHLKLNKSSLIMKIINLTNDSFSENGLLKKFNDEEYEIISNNVSIIKCN